MKRDATLQKTITESNEYAKLSLDGDSNDLILANSNCPLLFTRELCGLDDFGFFIMKNIPDIHIKKHSHEFIEIQYIFSGNCNQSIMDENISLSMGDFTIFGQQTIHSLKKGGKNDRLYHLAFTPEFLQELLQSMDNPSNELFDFIHSISTDPHMNDYKILQSTEYEFWESLFRMIYLEYIFKGPHWKTNLHHYLSILFNKLSTYKSNTSEAIESYSNKILSGIIKYINDNYRTATLDEISQKLNYHPAYVSSFLKKNTNTNFKKLLINKRIEIAKFLLVQTDYTVEYISEQIGYTNPNYFYRVFKKSTNLTPKKYRNISNSSI